jgi:hypothetical protein
MRTLPLILLVCACAAPGRDESAVARELAGLIAGEPKDCVIAGPTARLVARDRRTLVVEDGRTLWVSRLQADCPGLDPVAAVAIEGQSGRYCRGDRIRALEPGRQAGPWCRLESFTPYRGR